MRSKTILSVLAALILIGGLSYAGVQMYRARQGEECGACRRPMHHGARTVAAVNGKRVAYCCPACAISERQQSGANVEVKVLTDHLTGKELVPDKAFIVRGSDVNPCAHAGSEPRPDKHPMAAHYDRCSPSMLAFASQETANAFARQHGGTVRIFQQ
jgi:hypothetical protein